MTQRASFQETLDFCNAVREAGGANPLDALLPGIPGDNNECLIARNLNFSCSVGGAAVLKDQSVLVGADATNLEGAPSSNYPGEWFMTIENQEVLRNIADALDLKTVKTSTYGGRSTFFVTEAIVLPEAIGQVAADFDSAGEVAGDVDDEEYLTDSDKDLWKAFSPYIKSELLQQPY